ncbi:MAG: DUF4412 domain-containing protein [Bacteroidales bacterium]|nr:DUF4412 domain-containing protein [Bacteroidales bacterium]
MKVTHSDTLFYVYTVKDNNVRIDEYDKYKRVLRSYIVNYQNKSLMVINPNKHVYTTVESPDENKLLQNLEVVSTGNYKYINGFKCYQWRVRDMEGNTEMSYWIARDKFNFYVPTSQVAMSVDDSFLFFKPLVGPEMDGAMPLLIENRTLLRSPKSILSVIEVKQRKVDTSIFSVSKYQKFESLH